jgi:phosphoglycolate phosphatase-like HAD superfamily hydrolase
MIGDSRNDQESARAAGFDFVFAAYGYAAPDDPTLSAGGATIDSFSALHALLCG